MLLDIAILLAAGAAVAVGVQRLWAGLKRGTGPSRQAGFEILDPETASKPLRFGLPEGYEARARQLSAGSGVERLPENPPGAGWAPDRANAAEVLQARLVKLQAMLAVLLSASRRDDLARAEIHLQEIRDLRIHYDWQDAWEQCTLDHTITAVERALGTSLNDVGVSPPNRLS